LCTDYQGKRINSPNDLVVKSDGAIYFTDPSGALNNVGMGGDDLQRYLDFHGVFRLAPDGALQLVVRDFVYPNGLAFSPDESILYVNDTRAMLIRAFGVQADGALDQGSVFARVEGDGPGRPDGMKVDIEGNVYCTGPSGIHVFDAGGNWLGRIKVPGHITNFSFGGEDWRSLFVVTQTSVFRTRVGIPGLPVGPGA
jgi:gluconolactonase